MIKIIFSPHFLRSRKKFLKNNLELAIKVTEAIEKFVNNPFHPGLNLEKLINLDIWTIRIDRGNRIFLHWLNSSTALFIDIGKHDKYRKY